MTAFTTTAERWRSAIAKIDKRLADPLTNSKVAKELREIRAKLMIVGPKFLNPEHEKRIEALFDKRVH